MSPLIWCFFNLDLLHLFKTIPAYKVVIVFFSHIGFLLAEILYQAIVFGEYRLCHVSELLSLGLKETNAQDILTFLARGRHLPLVLVGLLSSVVHARGLLLKLDHFSLLPLIDRREIVLDYLVLPVVHCSVSLFFLL